jgi:DCN1-like protein 4/5
VPGTNPSPSSKKAEKVVTYTPQHALELFNIYTEKDDKNVIATEGFEQLCTDAKIPFDGALPLILAWQMGAKEMGKITKDEWMKGTNSLRISSLSLLSLAVTELEDLLIRDRAPLKPTGRKEDYDRSAYNTYARDVRSSFHKLYKFSYVLAKPEQSKNMDMEISLALWSVLLAPKYPIMDEVLQFINNNLERYKATNKDLWSMMLEFCQSVNPNLQDYEADGAWPTLLDDFVSSKSSETAANTSDS